MDILEGTTVGADRREETDALVIGSGAGGASVAMRLSEAGQRVLLLERGGYYTGLADPLDPTRPGRRTLNQREDDMLARIDGGRGLTTTEDGLVNLTYGNCVGGATVHYWADSYRTPEDRLERWERDFGVEGHSADVLRPYFDAIERDLEVHAAAEPYYNGNNLRFRRGVEALGWESEPVPQARKGCVQSGYCMQGCSYDAKQSMLVTYVPRALRAGAILYADCRVDGITVENGRATGAVASFIDRATGRPNGARLEVTSKVVILAAGGYGSAPILLRSKLANASGQLGRNLHANPCSMVFALFDEDVVMWRNIPAAHGCLEWRLARERDGRYAEGGYLLMPNQLGPAGLAAFLPGFGAEHRRWMEALPRIGGTIAWIDDHEAGDIRLGADGTPRYRLPIAGRNAAMLRDSMKKGARLLLAAGAREVFLGDPAGTRIRDEREVAKIDALPLAPGVVSLPAPHPAGACRMGRDPETSVVGSTGEAHDVRGLYVADPSVFPTAVSVDPSETIIAFSLRLADGLLERGIA
ncbi:MAG: GMC family oxidoreductase [Deltaproteobacteria bacterium]|nr:MAG: GMC family oxidoreductase [Deltaproteobacteria bacterium]